MGQTLQFLLKPSMVFISSSLSSKSNTCTEKMEVSQVQQPACRTEIHNSSPGCSPGYASASPTLGSQSPSSARGSAAAPGGMMTRWPTRLQTGPLTNRCWDFYLRRGFFVLLSDSFDGGFLQQGGVFWFSPAGEKPMLVKTDPIKCLLS